ncbi:Cytochrome P450 2J6like [Caligus rogercresseyi]|uniref:Cytochrome P450 2J6like n=1 Tax=Caligus rogercresseyi TaxID=217165 RepID=A0A7T8QVV4_CALRO|nr:Cytochrome P450 2J6like [Caligus rogercresseyi]
MEDLHRRLGSSPNHGLKHVNIYFDIPILNIIWWLVAGRRYSYGDPAIQKQFDYLKVFLEEPLMAPLTIIPFALKYRHLKGYMWDPESHGQL